MNRRPSARIEKENEFIYLNICMVTIIRINIFDVAFFIVYALM